MCRDEYREFGGEEVIMGETYISIDIETNGLCPGINSMISLGAVVFDPATGESPTSFQVNLRPLSDGIADPDTMAWWSGFPDAYAAATRDAVDPKTAMESFEFWVKAVAGENPVACYWKSEFDGAFIRYYLFRFLGRHIFGRSGSGLDIKTITALALRQKYSETQIGKVPTDWGFPCKKTAGVAEHNHLAIDDAREQANVLVRALKELSR